MSLINKENLILKAFTEGVYSDTPHNRKLGRVGAKYSTSVSADKANTTTKLTEEALYQNFKSAFEQAYEKKGGAFSVEQWRKIEELMSKLPEKWIKEAGSIKGLSYLSNRILAKNEGKALLKKQKAKIELSQKTIDNATYTVSDIGPGGKEYNKVTKPLSSLYKSNLTWSYTSMWNAAPVGTIISRGKDSPKLTVVKRNSDTYSFTLSDGSNIFDGTDVYVWKEKK